MTERYTYDLPLEVTLKKDVVQTKDIFEDSSEEPWAVNHNRIPSPDPTASRRMFDYLNAQQFIDETSVRDDEGALDIRETAKKVSLPIRYDASLIAPRGTLGGYGKFKGKSERVITLRSDLGRDENVTFAHEIGHFFLGEVVPHSERLDLYHGAEEIFCDYFGRAMAMPYKLVEKCDIEEVDEQKVLELARGFKTLISTAILQCIEYGGLTDKVAVDTYMYKCSNPDFSELVDRVNVCLHCTETGGDLYCPNAGKDSRLLDFTEYAWALELGNCRGEDRLSVTERSKLKTYYESLPRQIPLFHFDPLAGWEPNKSD